MYKRYQQNDDLNDDEMKAHSMYNDQKISPSSY